MRKKKEVLQKSFIIQKDIVIGANRVCLIGIGVPIIMRLMKMGKK